MISAMKRNKIERNSSGERFAQLARLGEGVFHTQDIANLWNIHNPNTLHTTLSRYVQSGLLHRIYKGLYAVDTVSNIDPYLLGVKALHAPAYISCESVLFDNGLINQRPQAITLMSRTAKQFSIREHQFRSRKLSDEFLFNDAGIETTNGVRRATPPRAVADMLHVYPQKHLDAKNSSLIDWRAVRNIATRVGYTIETLPRV